MPEPRGKGLYLTSETLYGGARKMADYARKANAQMAAVGIRPFGGVSDDGIKALRDMGIRMFAFAGPFAYAPEKWARTLDVMTAYVDKHALDGIVIDPEMGWHRAEQAAPMVESVKIFRAAGYSVGITSTAAKPATLIAAWGSSGAWLSPQWYWYGAVGKAREIQETTIDRWTKAGNVVPSYGAFANPSHGAPSTEEARAYFESCPTAVGAFVWLGTPPKVGSPRFKILEQWQPNQASLSALIVGGGAVAAGMMLL